MFLDPSAFDKSNMGKEGVAVSKKAWVLSAAYLLVVFAVFFALMMRSDQKKVQGKAGMDVFTLVVDYDRPLKDSIEAGCYDKVKEDITEDFTEENFPREAYERGRKEIVCKLFRFNRDHDIESTKSHELGSEEVIRKIREERCRPFSLRELLALGEAKPELRWQTPIVSLKPVWINRRAYSCVVFLSFWGDDPDYDRRIILSRYDSKWGYDYHFPAVVESNP